MGVVNDFNHYMNNVNDYSRQSEGKKLYLKKVKYYDLLN